MRDHFSLKEGRRSRSGLISVVVDRAPAGQTLLLTGRAVYYARTLAGGILATKSFISAMLSAPMVKQSRQSCASAY